KERVDRIRAAIRPADRGKVLSKYQMSLSMQGDVKRGQGIFLKNCASCHQVGEHGVNVGPDISDSRTQKPAQYLVHILDPNRTIDANYFAYTLVRSDGRILTGLITSEAGQSVTLRQQDGKDTTLVRDEIASVSTAGVSLMPVGFERTITPQQMADLITFLKEWRYVGSSLIPSTSTTKVQP
ncbi:MAG: c-type cytochrome, partial [Pirellulales bacterium]